MLCFVAFVLLFCNRNDLFSKRFRWPFSRRHENKSFHIMCLCTKHKSSIFGQLPLLSSQTKDIVCKHWMTFSFVSPNMHRDTKRDSETNSSFSFAHLPRAFSLHIIDRLRITWSDEVTVASNFVVYSTRIHISCSPHRFIRHQFRGICLWDTREQIHNRQLRKFKIVIFKIDCHSVHWFSGNFTGSMCCCESTSFVVPFRLLSITWPRQTNELSV